MTYYLWAPLEPMLLKMRGMALWQPGRFGNLFIDSRAPERTRLRMWTKFYAQKAINDLRARPAGTAAL